MNAADPFVRALTGEEEDRTVSLIRTYRAPVAEVWDAITSPDRIARWYGTISGPVPRRGGEAFEVDLGGGVVRRAMLQSCDAPTALTYTWWSGDDDFGLVRIRLVAVGEQTRMTVQHNRLRSHRMIQCGAGWEQNLVALAAVLGGSSGETPSGAERGRRWEQLRAHPLLIEVDVNAPVNAVWDAWATADGLRTWWWSHWEGVTIHADVRPGGDYRIEAVPRDIAVAGRYLVVEPERRLAFTWNWTDDAGRSRDEAVDVTFTQTERGTTLVIRHTGPWDDGAPAETYRQGWDFVLSELSRRLA